MTHKDCERYGHEYEARYDKVWPNGGITIERFNPDSADAWKNHIYVCDICIKCGTKIFKKEIT